MKNRKDRRFQTDNCLLCESEPATQRSSHILPKLMGNILFKDNPKHHVYRLSAASPELKPEILQDTVKEDYLFCPSCESYLGVLDGYFAEHIHKLIINNRGPVYFDSTVDLSGTQILASKKLDPPMAFLLIDSILLRCHLSSKSPFDHFVLPKVSFDDIRTQLLRFKKVKGNDLLAMCQNEVDSFSYRPYMISAPDDWSEAFYHLKLVLPPIHHHFASWPGHI